MKIIKQEAEIMDTLHTADIMEKLERCGRICYKSEKKMGPGSYDKFLRNIIKMGHESVLEHVGITVRAVTTRSVSHQLVRHRIASYSQESQRYCNYSKGMFNNEISIIEPDAIKVNGTARDVWRDTCKVAEDGYFELLRLGIKPEDAREVLPNCTATEIIMTLNIRAWRGLFKQRVSKQADSKMVALMDPLLAKFKEELPALFDDIENIKRG